MPVDTKDFIIKDRRKLSKDKNDSDAKPDEETEAKSNEENQTTEGETTQKKGSDTYQLPKINFATFIFSLNSSALVHLGALEDPATGKKNKNLGVAKQTIDIIGMLQEKTKGNLTEDEENMLKNILYDLRILYIKEKE